DETNVDESIKVLKPIFTDLDLYVQIIDKNIFQTSFSKWLKNFQSSENFKNPFELANHIIERLNIDNIFFINSYIYTNGIDVHGEFGVLVEHYILTNPNKSYLLELTADE
ncbi:MAG TPA: hypothetical protein PKW08_10140, partial [Flavobacteriaceae bacterium]|nr:hypothetical protein [Flavobacteriaceae bacterium]